MMMRSKQSYPLAPYLELSNTDEINSPLRNAREITSNFLREIFESDASVFKNRTASVVFLTRGSEAQKITPHMAQKSKKKLQVIYRAFLSESVVINVSQLAMVSLYQELALAPKPGLVSFADSGSHKDMDAQTFLKSITSLRSFFKMMTQAGMDTCSFSNLKSLGIDAEEQMLKATGGINTHRGAIFCLGLLCAAAGSCYQKYGFMDNLFIRQELLLNWGESLKEHARETEGDIHHGTPGARLEAALGMPSLFVTGLPKLKATLAARMPLQQALTETFVHLMASLHDTNIIRRGGLEGLSFVQHQSKLFIEEGGTLHPNWEQKLWHLHQQFKERRLSPGGSADVLAASLFIYHLEKM